jgi:hypothetical protein
MLVLASFFEDPAHSAIDGSGSRAGSGDCLPNLFIVGVTRAGTTSLFSYLGQHPEICPSRVKEPHFFSHLRTGSEPRIPLREYRGYFNHCGAAKLRMEATPVYFFGGRPLIQGLVEMIPDARALVSLRNPAERIWSNYRYKWARGEIDRDLSFDKFVDNCEEVRAAGGQVARDAGPLRASLTGFYADFLPDWFELLGDRFKVVLFDDLRRDARRQVFELIGWLGLEASSVAGFDLSPRNAALEPNRRLVHRTGAGLNRLTGGRLSRDTARLGALNRAYRRLAVRSDNETIPPATLPRLEQIYREGNQALGMMLRRRGYQELPDWLVAESA